MVYYSVLTSLKPRAAPRILGRRYALTATAHKHIEIGINVSSVSCVEVILGDNRGHFLSLPYPTWQTFVEKKTEVHHLLQSTEASATLWIRDLALANVEYRNMLVTKLTLNNACLFMKPDTVKYLLTLDSCIQNMYYRLAENVHSVNTKFEQFVTVLRQHNIADISSAERALRESELYDSSAIIDCELVACALPVILHDACRS